MVNQFWISCRKMKELNSKHCLVSQTVPEKYESADAT